MMHHNNGCKQVEQEWRESLFVIGLDDHIVDHVHLELD